MKLVKRSLEDPAQASRDEQLAARIVAHFVHGATFPEGEAGISRFGHSAPVPTPFALPWSLEPNETWLAHQFGTFFFGLESRGDFRRAGAAALLLTSHGIRLMLGTGGPERPKGWTQATRGDIHAPASKIETYRFRFIELEEIGAADLMYLRFWRLEQLVLRVQWARSLTAMISGLKLLEKQAPALENSVVNIPQVNIAQANPGPTSGRLEIQPNKANDHVIEVLGKQG
jgi:hypothetical protein